MTCRAELARWLTERCTCPFGEARHARDALIAVVYDRCCAPTGGGPSEHLLAAKYIAVTFLADDAHDHPPDLEGMVRYLTTGQADDGELVRCFSALVEELMAQGHDPTRFLRAVQDTITHRLREREVDARTVTWDEHWEIRRHTIAVAPYVWCRSTTRDLDWSETTEDALRESGVLVLASEAVARANDLASFPRESLPTPSLDRPLSLNSVLHYARDLGDLDIAVTTARDAYRTTIDHLRTTLHTLRQVRITPAAEQYLEILTATVNGNLDALRQMAATRYPGSTRILDGLPTVPTTSKSTPR